MGAMEGLGGGGGGGGNGGVRELMRAVNTRCSNEWTKMGRTLDNLAFSSKIVSYFDLRSSFSANSFSSKALYLLCVCACVVCVCVCVRVCVQ